MTGTPATRVLILAFAVAALAACSHSRVVQRDYDPPSRYDPPRNARPASRAVSEPVPRNGVHVVRRGETLYGISFRYGLRYQDVAAWNGIGDPYIIEIGQRLALLTTSDLKSRRQHLDALARHLDAVSPQSVLHRGYTITTRKKDGKVVRSAKDAKVGERLHTQFADGTVESVVEDQKQLPLFE